MQVNANSRVKSVMVAILVTAAVLALGAMYLSNRPDTTVVGPSAPQYTEAPAR
jgi:hypothetical protein